MRMNLTWYIQKLEELNRYSNRYTASELLAFKSGPISLEEAKQKYPNAKLHDIMEDDILRCFRTTSSFGKKTKEEKWDEILFVLDQNVIAYVDLNRYYFSKKRSNGILGFEPIFTIFWYNLELSTQSVTELTERETKKLFDAFYKKSLNIAESIRNSLVSIFPGKNYTYVPKYPLSQFDYLGVSKIIPHRVGKAKTKAIYNEEKKISQIQVEIDIKNSPEEIRERILKYKTENKKSPTSVATIPTQFFVNLPERGKIDQEIPITVLQKNFPRKYDLLFTLLFYVNSIRWLYKFSETTIGLSGNSEVNEVHILLIELEDVICNQSNRVIKNSTYYCFYFYGIEYATERKFLEYLDAIIPYQTICIFKINRDKSFPLYQIWSGKKSITMKGSKVKKYVHTDWMYEEELVRKPLEFNGKSLSEVFSNFLSQLGEK